jgi:hypothetical protein
LDSNKSAHYNKYLIEIFYLDAFVIFRLTLYTEYAK